MSSWVENKPNQSSVPCSHCSQIPQGLKDALAWQLAQSKAEQAPDKQRGLGMKMEKPGSMDWENESSLEFCRGFFQQNELCEHEGSSAPLRASCSTFITFPNYF